MASKRRNMFYENKKQETTEIGGDFGGVGDRHGGLTDWRRLEESEPRHARWSAIPLPPPQHTDIIKSDGIIKHHETRMHTVEDKLISEWFSPGYYVTQIISSHGSLPAKLAGFGLRDEGNCTCGVPETVGRILLECRDDVRPVTDSYQSQLDGAPVSAGSAPHVYSTAGLVILGEIPDFRGVADRTGSGTTRGRRQRGSSEKDNAENDGKQLTRRTTDRPQRETADR
ncbi:hypothetical protein AAG570_005457 [Ranatra chinensis]|uniref:Uncharacterized protein n=1 Tax=Ranatra chinensis TaxID=642074 RepID=A0ABD0XYI1_9HEMI